jgi:hypothetical protein
LTAYMLARKVINAPRKLDTWLMRDVSHLGLIQKIPPTVRLSARKEQADPEHFSVNSFIGLSFVLVSKSLSRECVYPWKVEGVSLAKELTLTMSKARRTVFFFWCSFPCSRYTSVLLY